MAQIDTINQVLLYASYFGSELDDDGKSIALGANGLVYYAGTTFGTQFPVAGPTFNQFPSGNYDIVLGAFDLTKSGVDTLVYGTYFGGSDIDQVNGMTLDAQGRMLLTGFNPFLQLPCHPADRGGGQQSRERRCLCFAGGSQQACQRLSGVLHLPRGSGWRCGLWGHVGQRRPFLCYWLLDVAGLPDQRERPPE
ncbi:MAG: hypothetical protein WDO73_28885 [Ignavibacteriota bacterium]